MTDQARAILFVLIAVFCGSVNDMGIKFLSGDYPLHQMIFFRSVVALVVCLVFLMREGGLSLLRTDRPGLHLFRAGLVMLSNMFFFASLAVMPLAAATALFFVAPLFITLLAIPILGEPVGRYRLTAIVIGLMGVAVMMAPGVDWGDIGRVSLLLPLAAAFCYSGMQVLTRKLGARTAPSAMAVYIQAAFLVVSTLFFLIAGDGRFADGATHPSVIFLLRAWVWPAPADIPVFVVVGLMSAMIGYFMARAYRLGTASVVASFEYGALPLAIFWGWAVFGEVPRPAVWVGIALIAGAGLYVFSRERAQGRALASVRPVRRD